MKATLELEANAQANTPMERLAGKYLTFTVNRESFGLDVLKVREIIRNTVFTPVPNMPPCVRGVINLRGKIIPVTDLRLRFGRAQAEDTEVTCIVVVQVKLNGESKAMGLLVDGVEDVVNIAAEDIEQTPDFGGEISAASLLGMAKVKGKVKALLDIDVVFSGTPLVAPARTPVSA